MELAKDLYECRLTIICDAYALLLLTFTFNQCVHGSYPS